MSLLDTAKTLPTDPTEWLFERLKQHGLDVYAPTGQFDSFGEQLGYVIAVNHYGPIVAGRHAGRPEIYQQFYVRIFGRQLPTVPRGTQSNSGI